MILYDKTTLEFVKDFGVRGSNSTVHLASYQESRFHMELYVADYVSISLIEMMQATKGDVYFKETQDIFIMDNPQNVSSTHEIFIGKSTDQLVYKLSSQPYLFLVETC